MTRRPALLALEDGTVYRGSAFGAEGETFGEVVFNTALTGYQEVASDPSYAGQIVVMTAPEMGNVGTNAEDAEAPRLFCSGRVTARIPPFHVASHRSHRCRMQRGGQASTEKDEFHATAFPPGDDRYAARSPRSSVTD